MLVIARRVAKDRIISTVDPDARHGHKTAARGFDGYKGHVAIDPDSELIVSTAVTAGNAADAAAVDELLADDLPPATQPEAEQPDANQADVGQDDAEQPDAGQAQAEQDRAGQDAAGQDAAGQDAGASGPLSVYGDSAYGTGEVLEMLERATRRSTPRPSRQPRLTGALPRTTPRSSSTPRQLPALLGTPSR